MQGGASGIGFLYAGGSGGINTNYMFGSPTNNISEGGGGGGGAGNAGNGGNGIGYPQNAAGSGGTGGVGSPNAAPYIGGTGGSSQVGTGGAAAATTPGGGGSGTYSPYSCCWSFTAIGGNGADGQVLISYNTSTTGINTLSNNNALNIYPNPSTGIIQVSYTGNIDELKVSNMLGQVVYEAKPNTTTTTLNLDNAGVYFITLTSGAAVKTQKIIITK